jgi:cell division protein FtsB
MTPEEIKFGEQCEHGHLKRVCVHCELEEMEKENQNLREEIEKLKEEFRVCKNAADKYYDLYHSS